MLRLPQKLYSRHYEDLLASWSVPSPLSQSSWPFLRRRFSLLFQSLSIIVCFAHVWILIISMCASSVSWSCWEGLPGSLGLLRDHSLAHLIKLPPPTQLFTPFSTYSVLTFYSSSLAFHFYLTFVRISSDHCGTAGLFLSSWYRPEILKMNKWGWKHLS